MTGMHNTSEYCFVVPSMITLWPTHQSYINWLQIDEANPRRFTGLTLSTYSTPADAKLTTLGGIITKYSGRLKVESFWFGAHETDFCCTIFFWFFHHFQQNRPSDAISGPFIPVPPSPVRPSSLPGATARSRRFVPVDDHAAGPITRRNQAFTFWRSSKFEKFLVWNPHNMVGFGAIAFIFCFKFGNWNLEKSCFSDQPGTCFWCRVPWSGGLRGGLWAFRALPDGADQPNRCSCATCFCTLKPQKSCGFGNHQR